MPDYDYGLIWGFLLLLGMGLVMVYSSSIAMAEASRMTGHNHTFFLWRQAAFIVFGLVVGFAAFQVRSADWQTAAPYLFLIGTALLVLVLVPGIGREVNGSQRWIALPGFNIQPSELMKLFVALYAADYTVRKASHMVLKNGTISSVWLGRVALNARNAATLRPITDCQKYLALADSPLGLRYTTLR